VITVSNMAAALGGEVLKGKGGPYVLCPGPGHSARDRSLSVSLSEGGPIGFVVHSHAGDDWRICREHVAKRLGQPVERRNRPERPKQPVGRSNASPANYSNSGGLPLWKEARDPRNTIVESYLGGRGLDLSDNVAGRVVRVHPHCPFGEGVRHPCMVVLFRSIITDALQAIHRTALTVDGKKIDRKMMGEVRGAAIKIDADENVEQGLVIGEGFETCLAARMLGLRPVWALGSAGAIAAFPVLPGIEALTILGESDKTGANQKAVKACAERWSAAGREVLVAMPRVAGDLNDALQS
jgi:putative DNA primase/helicase